MRLIKCDDPDNIGHSASPASQSQSGSNSLSASLLLLLSSASLYKSHLPRNSPNPGGHFWIYLFLLFLCVSAYAINNSFIIQILDSRSNTMDGADSYNPAAEPVNHSLESPFPCFAISYVCVL